MLLLFAGSYTWLMWPHPASSQARTHGQSRFSLLLFGMVSVMTMVCCLFYGTSFLWLFLGVSAIAGILLPMRIAFIAVIFCTLLPLFLALSLSGGVAGVNWWWLIALMLLVRGLGLDMIGISRLGTALRILHDTRRELARLKVEEERARMARDLHDLLGQTLSLITLKSELARHLITEDPERCEQELADIEHVARKSLRDVREAVAGYRQPRLESELEGASQLLYAAGIEPRITLPTFALVPEISAVLAWTVREGVTNVIRHSSAQCCTITLLQEHNTVRLDVINDVRQEQFVDGNTATRSGVGLSGLRERVNTLGGRMVAGPVLVAGKEHFHMQVTLPLQNQIQLSHIQEEQR
jgi:two-component system sensor histidine kinase DesK